MYFAFVSSIFGGVEQKIIAQFDALKSLGADIQLFLVSSYTPEETFAFEIRKRSSVNIFINSPEKISNSWSRRKEKFDLVSTILSEYDPQETIVYFRYPLADLLFLRFLNKHLAFKIVTEHQEVENKLRIGILTDNIVQDIFDFAFGRAVRNKIVGFVGVSSQYLVNQVGYLHSNIRHKKYFLINGNGIDTSKFQVRKNPHFDGQTLKLLFVGSGFKPQGLDRLLFSLKKYYNTNYKVNIIVHVVGVSVGRPYLSKYLENPKLLKSVLFQGFIQSEQIDEFADECHLAINSLSLHQIGIKVGSTLKSREYFARGIPFITSSSDDDIQDDNPFVIKVSADNKPIDFQKIIDYAIKLNEDPEHPQKMRYYALEYLDWSVKMIKLNAFFEQIMLKQPQ